ncbi:MAG TPA: hypothetical protein VFK37_06370 [Bacillales bacterium]|nr:hypothetical protein [Bacillales bacterium]
MLRRIGFYMIGAAAIHQAQNIFPDKVSANGMLTHFIFDPFDFLSLSLLFLIGFLLLSLFFAYFMKQCYLLKRKRTRVHGGDVLEFIVFASLVYILFHFGLWLPLFAGLFAAAFGWLSSDFRIEREVQRMEQDVDH